MFWLATHRPLGIVHLIALVVKNRCHGATEVIFQVERCVETCFTVPNQSFNTFSKDTIQNIGKDSGVIIA